MSAKKLLRKYEMIVVARNDLGHEAVRKLHERVNEVLGKHEGQTIRFENWGKRRLAYPIKKCAKGYFLYYILAADAEFVKEVQRMLRLNAGVLRFLTIILEKDVDVEAIDFEKEGYIDELPEDDENEDRGRSTTGWDAETAAVMASDSDDDEVDLDSDEDSLDDDMREED